MSGFDGKRKNMSNWHVLSCSYGSCVSLKVLSKRCKISRSPLAYRCSGLKTMPAKESLRMIGSSEGLVARYEAVYEVSPRSMRASDIRVAVAALC